MENEPTSFKNKCNILADFWMEYRDDESFASVIEYNDIGFPVAYALSQNIVKPTSRTESFIDETFAMVLATLGMEDEGFESFEDILGFAGEDEND